MTRSHPSRIRSSIADPLAGVNDDATKQRRVCVTAQGIGKRVCGIVHITYEPADVEQHWLPSRDATIAATAVEDMLHVQESEAFDAIWLEVLCQYIELGVR